MKLPHDSAPDLRSREREIREAPHGWIFFALLVAIAAFWILAAVAALIRYLF